MSVPIIFLAFANDTQNHLATLKRESSECFRALRELDLQEFVKVHREESADLGDLFDALTSYRDRVAIFHFGGHADGSTLRLEDGAGQAAGIANLLGDQANLKLVFLNGCATRRQVDRLLAVGVKCVIATSTTVDDGAATDFAVRFYQALASRRTIRQAFHLAQAYLKTRRRDARDLDVTVVRKVVEDASEAEGDEDRWGLFIADGHTREILDWRLPTYRVVGLPPEMLTHIGSSGAVNQSLIPLLEEMSRYNPDIYSQMLEEHDGEAVKRDSREFPELMVRNLPWPIGSQIRLVRQHDRIDGERAERLLSAYVRTSQLLYYILLSDTWDQVRRGSIDAVPPELVAVPGDEGALLSFDYLARAVDLYALLIDREVRVYVSEIERLAAAWRDEDSPIRRAHAWLERCRALGVLPDGASDRSDLEERCRLSERALSLVLRAVAFLARYRMLTVRDIAVDAPRVGPVTYEVNMGPLNAGDAGGLSLYQDAAQRRKSQFGGSHTIVLLRDEDDLADGLNLSPFLVDKNTFVGVRDESLAGHGRLAHVFLLAFASAGRLEYLAVDTSIRRALACDHTRLHTDMRLRDFSEGRNVVRVADTLESFGIDEAFASTLPTEDRSADVLGVLYQQFVAFCADLGVP